MAFVTRSQRASAGIAVSASHNPWRDNGIKLIGADGFKWDAADEAALERELISTDGASADGLEGRPAPRPLAPERDLVAGYVEWLAASLGAERPLAGLRIALDAANGAASAFAGPLFERLGAETVVLFAAPDGRNINLDCGSTEPRTLCREVGARGCDMGVAFDGDADRALFVDGDGELRDGDATLFLWARELARQGLLQPPAIVATSMSNLGLERALAAEGIDVVRCGVGDRLVVETLRARGLLLGGEQSGHIVHLGLSTTGDGLLTALEVAAIVKRSGTSLAALAAPFRRFPQILKNLRVASKPPLADLPRVRRVATRIERQLGSEGRLVLRYSGTEPLARVMIEGPDQDEIEELAGELAAAIRAEIGEEEPVS